MRLWSIHPKYLDSKGLLACWREGLLAKKVLEGKTKGYKNHAQLSRFKESKDKITSINAFLYQIYKEAKNRGYNFSLDKIKKIEDKEIINVTSKQIGYEFKHLLNKLKTRDIKKYEEIKNTHNIEINPFFKEIIGEIEEWEKI
ncbi:MAG: pyrimidine dimer DNA glycosylase/endonuclease V [Candidatus Gracilibacteria bacterium]|nr:pyrimidine dimer DNA glycosylase/endonuclease V [Candidatus Gracilibacteria bacterium]